jgi:hypothetical protein
MAVFIEITPLRDVDSISDLSSAPYSSGYHEEPPTTSLGKGVR